MGSPIFNLPPLSHQPTFIFTQAPNSVNNLGLFVTKVMNSFDFLSNFIELQKTFDIKQIFEKTHPGNVPLIASVNMIPFRASYLSGNQTLNRLIFKYHRNDPEELFHLSEDQIKIFLDIFQILYPYPDGYKKEDCILTCLREDTQKLRFAFLKALGKGVVENIYSDTILSIINETISSWQYQESPLNMSRELKILTSKLICRIIFGFIESPDSDLTYEGLAEAIDITGDYYARLLAKKPIDPLKIEITQKMVQMLFDEAYNHPTTHFMKTLKEFEVTDKLSEKQVKGLMIAVLVGGLDTSKTVLIELFWDLANEISWQDQIADSFYEDPDFIHSENDPGKCEGLAQTIYEALRLLPPFFAIGRTFKTDTILQEKIGAHANNNIKTIPAGYSINACPYLTAKNPMQFPSPKKYDPERHDHINLDNPTQDIGWNPFGDGIHKCPGRFFFWSMASRLLYQTIKEFRIGTPQQTKPATKSFASEHFVEDLFISLEKR